MVLIDNAVINNVLCFLSTSRHVLSEQSIISSCMTFYKEDLIVKAKEVLFNCIVDTIPRRKGNNKTKSDITDMLVALKTCDDKQTPLPTFLCDGFAKMPPGSGFESMAEHIMRLVNEVSAMKDEIRNQKDEIKALKNQGGTSSANKVPPKSSNHSSAAQQNKAVNEKAKVDSNATSTAPAEGDCTEQTSVEPPISSVLSSAAPIFVPKNDDTVQNTGNEKNHYAWHTVDYKKKNKRALKGSKPASGLFKGVQETKDLYVGRCNPTVKDDDIKKYIKEEMETDVISIDVISKSDSPVKAFKVTLKSKDIEKLLDANLWPENIRVRKYFSKFSERKSNTQ